MSVEGLEHYTKDQLIEELINRQTFVGIVIFDRGEAKPGRLDSDEIVMTKSPPLTREGVEFYLQMGESLVSGLFSEEAAGSERPEQSLPAHFVGLPLRWDDGGVLRVGNSRISFDLIVEQYDNGMTPEEMVRAYDTLLLADVYAAIAYYLGHRNAVRAYLKRRGEEADALRAKIEAEHPPIAREELLTRHTAREKDHAPTGQ